MQRLADRPGLALLVVVGVAAALDLFGIRDRILIVGDESLYAAAAREMLERSDWIVPSFNYQPRYQKPILIYWLIGASYHALGVSEAAARLPSAAFGVLLCALVFALGRRLGGALTGLAAGLVMATNVATVGLSRVVMTDVILCAFTTAAITGFVFAESERERGGSGRKPTLLAFAALAGGFLVKGPVAVLVPALVWLPWLAWRGALGRFLRRRDLWARRGALRRAGRAVVHRRPPAHAGRVHATRARLRDDRAIPRRGGEQREPSLVGLSRDALAGLLSVVRVPPQRAGRAARAPLAARRASAMRWFRSPSGGPSSCSCSSPWARRASSPTCFRPFPRSRS